MLGRLFKQNSSASLNKDAQTSTSTPASNMNSFEDHYTRDILYGVGNKSILSPFELQNKCFRIIVSQDGGSIRSKQVLFDTSLDEKSTTLNSGNGNVKQNLLRNMAPSKLYHHPNEINDYMFGGGLPSNELQSITKIHLLPVVNSPNANYRSVLITRLFLISDIDAEITFNNSDWSPKPTLPINHSKISFSTNGVTNETNSNTSSSNKHSISSRFAIGLVIPIDDNHITDIISNNWHEICQYLIILQKVVYKKILSLLNRPNENFIINKRIQFPSYILSNDLDLNNNLLKLIKLINYNANIPKLMNSNALMRLSLMQNSNEESSKYSPMVVNWVLEILNWLEFKELNESSKFLASLLALIIPYRFLLTEKPFNHNYFSDSKEITRIVVMTGNPMVAKKLVFILNGLIPDYDMFQLLKLSTVEKNDGESQNQSPEIAVDDSFLDPDTVAEIGDVTKILMKRERKERESDSTKVNKSPLLPQASNTSGTNIPHDYGHIDTDIDTDVDEIDEENLSSLSLPSPPLMNTHPIPIKSKNTPSRSFSSSENSFSQISTKGWEITGKASPVISTSVSNSVNSKTIPINKNMRRESLTKSTSMAYLSSSLNSSISSSTSNYSLSKLGGSFIDKWKNSFNSSVNNFENIDYHPNANYGSSFSSSNQTGQPNRHISFLSLKTPSPAVEEEAFNFSMTNSSNATPSPVLTSNISQSVGFKPLSKTQSMFDLYNNSNSHSKIKSKTLGDVISRSKASVYSNKDFSKNDDVIKDKIKNIMEQDFEFLEFNDDEDTLEIKDESHFQNLTKYEMLPPNVAFSDEFRPEFTLQSCPMNPRLEQQIISAMKNDLLFHQNNCKVENITTRTIFISLRAREVKLIEMKVGDSNKNINSCNASPQLQTGSPLNSYFSHVQSQNNGAEPTSFFRRSHNSYKTTIKKIYSPTKNNGDLDLISQVENNLNEIKQLFSTNDKEINNDCIITNDFNEKLSNLVSSLLN